MSKLNVLCEKQQMFILDQRDPRSWYDEQLKLTGVDGLWRGSYFQNGLVVRGNLSKTKLLSFCHTQTQ